MFLKHRIRQKYQGCIYLTCKNKQQYCEMLLQYKITIFVLNCNLFPQIFSIITPVFSVT